MVFMPLILIYIAIIFILLGPFRFVRFIYHILAGSLRKARVILVYSDSAKWKEYVELEIIPHLPENSLIFNISHPRNQSLHQFNYNQFRFWAGKSEYCPIVIVRRRFMKPLIFRFFKAFRKLKGGDSSELRAQTNKLLTILSISSSHMT